MFYEFQRFGAPEYFCKEYGQNFCFPMHLHRSFEFVTVFEGETEITVDNNVYTIHKGEALLIFPEQLHSFTKSNSKHMLCIFTPELINAYSNKITEKIPENNKYSPDEYLINTLDTLSEDSSTIEKKALLYSLCAQFDKTAKYTDKICTNEKILYTIFKFVTDNYSKDCSLNHIAKKTGYSYSYLSRYFKKTTGISYNTYINQYRIDKACAILKNTNATVLECAYEVGYTSLRSFNRNFKIYTSVTPQEYRMSQ